jgi:hypothetical protein
MRLAKNLVMHAWTMPGSHIRLWFSLNFSIMRPVPDQPTEPLATRKHAVQPFTFGGVARLSRAPFLRLFGIALLFAVFAGLAVARILSACWAPVITEAVQNLPDTGSIEGGTLHWPDRTGKLLGANPFLSIDLSTNDDQIPDAPADLMIGFRASALIVRSIAGFTRIPYPSGVTVALNRTALDPLWGAWRVPCIAGGGAAAGLAVLFSWGILAVLYSPVVLALAGLGNRESSFGTAWKLGIAAQLPGALVMSCSLLLYSTGRVSLIFIVAMLAAHFVPTAIYLLISPFFLPRLQAVEKENPFNTRKTTTKKNPFSGSR